MSDNKSRYPGNVIHETALIAEGVIIGKGNIIGPYCIIGFPPEWKGRDHMSGHVIIGNNNHITGLVTIDSGTDGLTHIGSDCWLLKGAHIGHDAKIGDRVTISCKAIVGGHTIINDDCNLGLGAIIHQKQVIREGCMIGMGAVVTKKLVTEPYCKYVGNPARYLGTNDVHPNYTIFMKDSL